MMNGSLPSYDRFPEGCDRAEIAGSRTCELAALGAQGKPLGDSRSTNPSVSVALAAEPSLVPQCIAQKLFQFVNDAHVSAEVAAMLRRSARARKEGPGVARARCAGRRATARGCGL
jgi:hypothetical protein